MSGGLPALSEREKETLRLLLGGHDAKSIARDLGLSVHTVNERLRDARRKLEVSSSREAARLLGEAERSAPDFHVDKEIGVAAAAMQVARVSPSDRRQGAGRALAWLSGGMLIMSLIIAAILLSSMVEGGSAPEPNPSAAQSIAKRAGIVPRASVSSAREWLTLVDSQRWKDSWLKAGTPFKSQITAAQWASTIQSVRKPLGAVSSRTLLSATATSTLPGAPRGEYEIVQFQTSFAQGKGAIETVVLAREGSAWTVAGYFIR